MGCTHEAGLNPPYLWAVLALPRPATRLFGALRSQTLTHTTAHCSILFRRYRIAKDKTRSVLDLEQQTEFKQQ